MSTSKIFKKHFGNTTSVDLKHPNTEAFFEELNAECIKEDKHKICNIPNVVKSFYCQKPTDYKANLRCKTQCGLCANFEDKRQ